MPDNSLVTLPLNIKYGWYIDRLHYGRSEVKGLVEFPSSFFFAGPCPGHRVRLDFN